MPGKSRRNCSAVHSTVSAANPRRMKSWFCSRHLASTGWVPARSAFKSFSSACTPKPPGNCYGADAESIFQRPGRSMIPPPITSVFAFQNPASGSSSSGILGARAPSRLPSDGDRKNVMIDHFKRRKKNVLRFAEVPTGLTQRRQAPGARSRVFDIPVS